MIYSPLLVRDVSWWKTRTLKLKKLRSLQILIQMYIIIVVDVIIYCGVIIALLLLFIMGN